MAHSQNSLGVNRETTPTRRPEPGPFATYLNSGSSVHKARLVPVTRLISVVTIHISIVVARI